MIGVLLDDKLVSLRDETYSIVKASEAGLKRYIDEALHRTKEEIVDAVIDVIDGGILPQIENHDREIVKIKRHLQLV